MTLISGKTRSKLNNPSVKYVVIAIYGGDSIDGDAISAIDGTPGYLHVHAVRKDELEKLPVINASAIAQKQQDKTIYQWGFSSDKDLGARFPVVSIGDVLQYGDLGVGSAAAGGAEEKSSFVGGGEVFLVPCAEGVRAFRITKGQGIFPLQLEDCCWTVEVIRSDSEAMTICSNRDEIVNSREELLNLLQQFHCKDGSQPFIAIFEARFERENFAIRSNGIFPQDEVADRTISLFTSIGDVDPVGGHVLGDSASESDAVKKHQGIAPKFDAKIILQIVPNTLKIIATKNKLIALKENVHQFSRPLSQRDLKQHLQIKAHNHKSVLIIGGGIAGVTAALKLAKVGIVSTIVDQREKLFGETSSKTPGRVGHGFHYRDLATAKLYLQSSITFVKENCCNDRFVVSLQSEDKKVDCGVYFIAKDSQVSAPDLLKIYEGIREEYRRLVELDPKNKVFGEVDDFIEILDLEKFRDVANIDKMALALRTQERLLNWQEFEEHLTCELQRYKDLGLISVINGYEVVAVEYDKDSINEKFLVKIARDGVVEELLASYIINATWANIEAIDSGLFPEAKFEQRTNRIKLIASIELPEDQIHTPSMFTAMGPYSMFSNEGNCRAKTTYAPVTNFLDYIIDSFKNDKVDDELMALWKSWVAKDEIPVPSAEYIPDDSLREIEKALVIPKLYKRWLAEDLNEEEQKYFGFKILEGSKRIYPALMEAKLVKVGAGIVKSNGEVNINNPYSDFHGREDYGITKRGDNYFCFKGVKLFYVESQSRKIAELIISSIRSNRNKNS